MMTFFGRVISGSPHGGRASRFHDENNVFMGVREFVHVPHAFYSWMRRHVSGELPAMPWWPYSAIAKIEEALTPQSVVLEYGIGMSTLWLGRRARLVYSIEGAPEWYSKIQQQLAERGVTNVRPILRDSTKYAERGQFSDAFNEEFASLQGIPESSFDLIVVDGAARWRCVEIGLLHLSSGGHLYLDNSDADKDWAHYTGRGLRKEAQKRLISAEQKGMGELAYFRGLSPATMHASEGMLFRKH